MKTSHSARYHVLVLALGLTATAAIAEEPKKPKATAVKVPERFVVTDEASAAAPSDARGVRLDAVPRGRAPMALDASGTRRGPEEPRMITGSFIPQKVEVYGNVTTASVNLRLYTPGDLNTGGNGFSRGSFGSGVRATSYTEVIERVRSNHILDLRTVEPARRLEVATKLLGEERGRKLVADFTRWEVTRKRRLAAR